MVQVVLVATSCVTVLLWRALYELFQGLLLLLDALLFNGLVPFLFARTFLVYHPINMHCHENCEKQAIYLLTFIPRRMSRLWLVLPMHQLLNNELVPNGVGLVD